MCARGWSSLMVVMVVMVVMMIAPNLCLAKEEEEGGEPLSPLPCIPNRLSDTTQQPLTPWCSESGGDGEQGLLGVPIRGPSRSSTLSLGDVLALVSNNGPIVPFGEGELKRSAFRPWGGKRWAVSLLRPYKPYQTIQGIDYKRAPFSAWRGKRLAPEREPVTHLEPYLQLPYSTNLAEQDSKLWDYRYTLSDTSQKPNADDVQLLDAYYDDVPERPIMQLNGEAMPSALRLTRYKRDAQTTPNTHNKDSNENQVEDNSSSLETNHSHITKRVAQADKGTERRAFSAWSGKRDGPMETANNSDGDANKGWSERSDDYNDIVNTYQEDLQSRMSVQKEKTKVKREAFSAWAGKREDSDDKRQAFNAWAGKRDDLNDKRQAFSPWAGKRDNTNDKRRSFSAWAGKRDDSSDKRQAFSAWAGKRQGFSAWAGKREDSNDKRQSFSAWAGKRDELDEKRQAFSPWAGKRDYPEKKHGFSAWAGKREDPDEKRQAFSAWAGKRDSSDLKRQAFSAWAGKRDDTNEKWQAFTALAATRDEPEGKRHGFSAWAGKREDPEEKRQAFSAWAGKRDDPEEKRQGFSAWAGKRDDSSEKRQAFSAWAGKRDETNEKRQGFSAWAGKRGDPEEKRHGFSAWAGKRDQEDTEKSETRLHKRSSFGAWKGKRSINHGAQISRQISRIFQNLQQRPPGPLHRVASGNSWTGKRVPFSSWRGKRSYSASTVKQSSPVTQDMAVQLA